MLADEGERGVVYCVWGEFIVHREELRHGVRFSMPKCPNALAWTVTIDDGSDTAVVHCTINKKEHDPDFIETIEEFVRDWETGVTAVAAAGVARADGG